MLIIKFTHILDARGITNHFTYLVDSGFSRHTASNLLHSTTRSFRLDHIERLCRILICEPNDILSYYPSKKHPLSENHPLKNLIKSEEHTTTMGDTLKYLPYKDLMNMSNQIHNAVNSKKEKPDNHAEPL